MEVKSGIKMPNFIEKMVQHIEYANGTKEWWQNGKWHREDGPAIEDFDGNKFWYQYGRLHREDGPAAKDFHCNKFWYKNGLYHREDGPAIECFNGIKSWWLNGKHCGNYFTNEFWAKFVKVFTQTVIFS